jgi:hypothetical protein
MPRLLAAGCAAAVSLNFLENILNNPQYCRNCKFFCSDKTCPLKPPSIEQEAKEKINENTVLMSEI